MHREGLKGYGWTRVVDDGPTINKQFLLGMSNSKLFKDPVGVYKM